MILILKDRLDGHHGARVQVPGPADDAKGAVANDVQVPEPEDHRLLPVVLGLHAH